MAVDKSIYGKLRRLFTNNVVVRRIDKDTIRVIDTGRIQSTGTDTGSKRYDRYTRLHRGKHDSGGRFGSLSNQNFFTNKADLYSEYELMDNDPIIASAIDIYAEESVLKDDFGEILRITSNDDTIRKVLYNLFYDILNIEFNLWPWVRNLCKYGDMYLYLDIREDLGVVGVHPLSAYEVTREETGDPVSPDVKFRLVSDGRAEYESWQIAHFRLLNDANFLPYGKSMVESARKTWKALTLLEDAMLIHRIMRAPERLIHKIDVGNLEPDDIDAMMEKIIQRSKKIPFVDEKTGDYNLRFNLTNMLEDYYLPVRGGQSSTEIDTLPGMEFTGIEDIEYVRNKMLAALKIPKAFIGFDEALSGGKATLAAEDVRFARTIERIQRMVISELTKIAIIHLATQGYDGVDLINFELTMTSPSTIYETEKVTLYEAKVSLAKNMLETSLISREWVYKNIFNFTNEEIMDIQKQVVTDKKWAFRIDKIQSEGEDIATDFFKMRKARSEEDNLEDGADGLDSGFEIPDAPDVQEPPNPNESPDDFATRPESAAGTGTKKVDGRSSPDRKKPEVPKGGWPGAGRPKEGLKYNQHEHPRGYDPLGKVAWRNARNESFDVLKKFGLENVKAHKPKLLTEVYDDTPKEVD